MVIYGSYMFEFSVGKDMAKKDITWEVAVGKIATHFISNTYCQRIKN
jgi:hypothetical protein